MDTKSTAAEANIQHSAKNEEVKIKTKLQNKSKPDVAAAILPTENGKGILLETLILHYRKARQKTLELIKTLSPEDMQAQSMPDCSPTKWHLAHSTWFFEKMVLGGQWKTASAETKGSVYQPVNPVFDQLFNSYYESVGWRVARPERGLQTRPTLQEVLSYRKEIDSRMQQFMSSISEESLDPRSMQSLRYYIELGINHEQQHCELMIMDILHLFSRNPLKPAYLSTSCNIATGNSVPNSSHKSEPIPLQFVEFKGGLVKIGYSGSGFAFDNEKPQHKVFLHPFKIANRLVTNAEWLAFISSGGYKNPQHWTSSGWAAVQRDQWDSPLYWRNTASSNSASNPSDDELHSWKVFGVNGERLLTDCLHEPVSNISWYEADAFARWSGKRLPSEAEWEHACITSLGTPTASSSSSSSVESVDSKLKQMFGICWQHTSSPYIAYPAFKPAEGAVSEYNGKFMSCQMVLRGSCFATPAGHERPTYRNFFHCSDRWMFAGLRLAEDIDFDDTLDSDSPLSNPLAVALTSKKVDVERLKQSPFFLDLKQGLAEPVGQKTLPCKYFYDEVGSKLFDKITQLPEYYPTRAEIKLLTSIVAKGDLLSEISSLSDGDKNFCLVEFGSGSSEKTQILLDTGKFDSYVSIDISKDALDSANDRLEKMYNGPSSREKKMLIQPLHADFTQDAKISLPSWTSSSRLVGFFPGSTLGNFEHDDCIRLLKSFGRVLGASVPSYLLLGVDLVKNVEIMKRAYDDDAGVTCLFNKNILLRANKELDANFRLDSFEHRARWNSEKSRMEMHLVSRVHQAVSVLNGEFAVKLEAGETIHTENSHKFTIPMIKSIAEKSGQWEAKKAWVSAEEPKVALILLEQLPSIMN